MQYCHLFDISKNLHTFVSNITTNKVGRQYVGSRPCVTVFVNNSPLDSAWHRSGTCRRSRFWVTFMRYEYWLAPKCT